MDRERSLDAESEIEFAKEQIKLNSVIEIINKEILNYINDRREISDKILEYRRKNIEEFKDDEDKLIEYFDHENYVKEEAFNLIDKRLKELTTLEKYPYYGNVKFVEDGFGEDNIYIGRFGITPRETGEPLVVDWRAPVASLFYGSKLGKNSYKAPAGEIGVDVIKKRQYIIKKKKLIGLFDTDVDVKDDILQLLLSKNAEEKLKDIVMSIQEEQDIIIRQPRNKAVVVNGVAGSGKTTIALHRVAYLLYNYRDVLQDKVLILGPNSIFMEYISSVLPSLGEVGVEQKTYSEYAIELLDLRRRDVMSVKDYMEKILNGHSEFIADVVRKNSDIFIQELNKLISKTEKEFKLQPVIFNEKIVMTKEECEKLFNEYYVNMPLFRRTKKIKRIIYTKLKDERDIKIRKIEEEFKDTKKQLNEEELKLQITSIEYSRKNKIREVVKEIMEVKKLLSWLDNPEIFYIYKEIFNGEIYTVDDLSALLYLSLKFEGLTVDREIKHVVIDEAQDYSKLAFLVIREITKCLGMTIVGDNNQRLIPCEGEIAIDNIENALNGMEVEHFKLNKSYKYTKEIMDYASKYLKEDNIIPLVRKGEAVDVFNINSETNLILKISELVKVYKQEEYDSIAVICKDLNSTEKLGKNLKRNDYIKIINKEHMIYGGGVVVIPSYLAKGLEFDAVIFVEEENMNDKVKYTMATRALHRLSVIKVATQLFSVDN